MDRRENHSGGGSEERRVGESKARKSFQVSAGGDDVSSGEGGGGF